MDKFCSAASGFPRHPVLTGGSQAFRAGSQVFLLVPDDVKVPLELDSGHWDGREFAGFKLPLHRPTRGAGDPDAKADRFTDGFPAAKFQNHIEVAQMRQQ